MILNATTKTVEIILGEATVTNDMDVTVAYADITPSAYTDGASDGASNGVTAATIVAAPAASTQRRVKDLIIYNNDTVAHAVTVRLNNNGTYRVLWIGTVSIGQLLIYSNGSWTTNNTAAILSSAIEFVIDGFGTALGVGLKGYLEVPFNCDIKVATLLADQSGAIVVDVWKCTYAQFDAGSTHPVVGDKITATAPPTIAASGVKSQDSTLTGWTIHLAKGDILAINVNSATTITRVLISLRVDRS